MDNARVVNTLLSDKKLTFQIFDTFPVPTEIFNAKGTIVFANRALLELNGIKDADFIIGKYNLLNDPVCNDLMGFRESIQKAFSGEMVSIPEFRPPIQDLFDRGIISEKPYESALMEVYLSPIKNKDALRYVVCVFIVKTIYRGKPELARAKEYLSLNWQGKFDQRTMAKSLNTSVSQLYRLFKEEMEMTPGEYHKQCKVEHIKEKLADRSLSVKEAFKVCGEDSRGWMAKVFKDYTGLSPAQFRKQN